MIAMGETTTMHLPLPSGASVCALLFSCFPLQPASLPVFLATPLPYHALLPAPYLTLPRLVLTRRAPAAGSCAPPGPSPR